MKKFELNLSKNFIAVSILSIFGIFMASEFALAATNNDAITQVLCNVVNQLSGGIGKAIATIAIIVLGIGLFIGKLSWPLAIATAVGIGMIFGAASIVNWISAGTGGNADAGMCG
ncbi:MAG: TrbC/VirB2 family protein [Rickettsiales bacterium]